MTISILSNIPSLRASNDLNALQRQIEQSSARLSTGKRILSAADDPAGVGILSTLQAQSVSYAAVDRNIGSGVSILETASTALEGQQTILQQMKDLATQAASDVLNSDQREAINRTFAELQGQLDTTVNRATIFGNNLVGSNAADVTIQSGINAGDTFTISAVQSTAETLGVQAAEEVDDGEGGTETVGISLGSSADAQAAMTAIDSAIATVAGNQSVLGAQQNGLEALNANNKKVDENIQAAISRIQDVDIAEETANLRLLQAREQFSTALLGVINSFPSTALALLR